MRFESRDSATAFVIAAIVLPLTVVALVVGSEDWTRAPAPLAVAVCGAVTLVLTARFRSWTAARRTYPSSERWLAELVRTSPVWLGGLWPIASPFGVDVELMVTAAVVTSMWLVTSVQLNARGTPNTVDPQRALRRRWDLVALVLGVWALAVGTDPSPTAASVRADVTLASAAALIALYWGVFAYLRTDVSLTREQRQRADDPWLLAIGVGLLQYWAGSVYGVVAAILLAAAFVRLSERARARALVRAGVGPPPRRRGRVPQSSRDRLHEIMRSGTPEEYLAAAESLCAEYPDDAELQVRRAVGLEGTGQFESAERLARETAAWPSADDSTQVHAAALLFRAHRDEDVAAILERVDPTPLVPSMQAEMHFMRGVLAASSGRLGESERRLKRAISLDPREERYAAALAKLRAQAGGEPPKDGDRQ